MAQQQPPRANLQDMHREILLFRIPWPHISGFPPPLSRHSGNCSWPQTGQSSPGISSATAAVTTVAENQHLPLDPYPYSLYKPADSGRWLYTKLPRLCGVGSEPSNLTGLGGRYPYHLLRNFGDRIPCRRQQSRPWLSMLARNYLADHQQGRGMGYSRAVSSTFADKRPSCSSTRCRYS